MLTTYENKAGGTTCKPGRHKWQFVKDAGKHGYQQCAQCGERRIIATGCGGYQPKDEQWLRTGVFTEVPTEKRGAP